jgi:acetyl-CoA carboxylase carboxyltransferase component
MGNSKNDSDNDWTPELEELHLRESLASNMEGPENLVRQRAAGRLNVRERIDLLLDKGSFHTSPWRGPLKKEKRYQHPLDKE